MGQLARVQKAERRRSCGGPARRVDAELPVDRSRVCVDGVRREEQLTADVTGRQLGSQQPEHRELGLARACEHLAPVGAGTCVPKLSLDLRCELRQHP